MTPKPRLYFLSAMAPYYPASPKTRLQSVDLLRGLAVLAVVCSHLGFSVRGFSAGGSASAMFPSEPIADFLPLGQYGVQLFLVISGFCIHMRWSGRSNHEAGVDFIAFWKRRLVRLYPPYFVVLLLTLTGTFVLHTFLLGGTDDSLGSHFGYAETSLLVVDLVLLLLMLQNVNGAAGRIGNAPLWSLALEEQLYLLYFPLLWLRRRHGWRVTLAVVAVATFGWRIAGLILFEDPPLFWYFVGPAYWLPWALGAVAVEAYHGKIRLPGWTRSPVTALFLLAAGVLLDFPSGYGVPHTDAGTVLDSLLICTAFFIAINRLAEQERTGHLRKTALSEVVVRIGVWSYSIYLVHLIAMVAVKQVALHYGLPLGFVFVLRLLFGIGAGYLFFRLIEGHFQRLSRRFRVS